MANTPQITELDQTSDEAVERPHDLMPDADDGKCTWPDREQEEREKARTKRDQQLRDIQTSLNHAADMIDESRREVARSQQLARKMDDLSDQINADRVQKDGE